MPVSSFLSSFLALLLLSPIFYSCVSGEGGRPDARGRVVIVEVRSVLGTLPVSDNRASCSRATAVTMAFVQDLPPAELSG